MNINEAISKLELAGFTVVDEKECYLDNLARLIKENYDVEITSENIKYYQDKIISAPQQHLSNDYTTVYVGGHNLTIGEMIEKANATKLYGGFPTHLTIKDDSENTLYVIDLNNV